MMAVNWNKQPLGKVRDSDLARRLGVSRERVRQMRAKRGIPRVPRASELIDWDAQPLGEMSDGDIGRSVGVSGHVVRTERLLRGIASLQEQEHDALGEKLSYEVLHQMYVVDELSTYAMSEFLDVANETIYKYLTIRGIQPRTRAEAAKTSTTRDRQRCAKIQAARLRRPQLYDEQWLWDRYWGDELSMPQVGALLGVGVQTIQNAMCRLDIPRRSPAQALEVRMRSSQREDA